MSYSISMYSLYIVLLLQKYNHCLEKYSYHQLKNSYLFEGGPEKIVFFFSIRVFFHRSGRLHDSRGMEGIMFYFSLPLPPTQKHSDIYLQLCLWAGYNVFLIASLVTTRLLLDEIYHLIELPFDWLMIKCLFLFVYLMIWF